MSNLAEVGVYAGRTSPMTIVDLKLTVLSRKPMVGNQRIRCQYGAGGLRGTRLEISLDSPARKNPMDIDGDMKADTTLPGGVFVVEASKAELLILDMAGTSGMVYEYIITLSVVENGYEREETLGSAQRPLLTAFPGEFAYKNQYFDWSPQKREWHALGAEGRPGEQCGRVSAINAGGAPVDVVVLTGAIECGEARTLVSIYYSLPYSSYKGSGASATVNGWECSSYSPAKTEELSVHGKCIRGIGRVEMQVVP